MDEHEALSALRRRDERALEWFIDRYAAYVGAVAANILASALSVADAEEVSADVFYTLWVNAKRIRPGKVKPYLAGVARNKAKERLRRCGAELPLEDDVLLLSEDLPERRLEARADQVHPAGRTVHAAARARDLFPLLLLLPAGGQDRAGDGAEPLHRQDPAAPGQAEAQRDADKRRLSH